MLPIIGKNLFTIKGWDSQCPTPHAILSACEPEKRFEMDWCRSSAHRLANAKAIASATTSIVRQTETM
jgi:hypothetical protein